MSRILIIDDDKALCRSLEIQLKMHDHSTRSAQTAAEGLKMFGEEPPDLILVDLGLPDRSGLDLLREVRDDRSGCPVVMITGQQDMKATIEAIRLGALDYIRKPFDFDDILLVIEKANTLGPAAEGGGRPSVAMEAVTESSREIVGADKKIVEIIKQIGLLSKSPVTVLIEGESGTGKELVAQALHEARDRARPFVALNCSAIVSNLLESELFGHEKGAFTGAETLKRGKLELAGTGTVFFDEIGDMPLDLQAKLLRALQEREFERVGGSKSLPLEARIIAATNQDLAALVDSGGFRNDLYYRIAVSRLHLPPLRERRGDVRLLTRHLLDRIGRRIHRAIDAVDEIALRCLEGYDWPGNVRELENVLTRAATLTPAGTLSLETVERALGRSCAPDRSAPSEVIPLREAEKHHIEKALITFGWNISQTARALEISPTTLRKKIHDYRLRSP